MAGHHVVKCSCGTIIAQCRCFRNHKEEIIKPNACEKCQATKGKKKK